MSKVDRPSQNRTKTISLKIINLLEIGFEPTIQDSHFSTRPSGSFSLFLISFSSLSLTLSLSHSFSLSLSLSLSHTHTHQLRISLSPWLHFHSKNTFLTHSLSFLNSFNLSHFLSLSPFAYLI